MKEEKKEKKNTKTKKTIKKKMQRKEGAYLFSPTFAFRKTHSSCLPLSMFLQC
jgi:hypothetical protein